jgi:hypothetical protein
MPFNVPNAVNYSSPLNAVPLDWTSSPIEGAKGIQCTVAWGTQGGPNNAVYVNCQNNATLNFSKIRALIIDNSQSGADIQFIFPDTETTVSVPAYTPYAIIPVFTNQTQFYLVSPLAKDADKTNFTILNTAPPPVAVPTTQEQNFVYASSVNIAGASGTVPLVPAGTDGTIENVFIGGEIGAVAGGAASSITLSDGTGKVIAVGQMSVTGGAGGTGVVNNVTMFSQSDLHVRFTNGLNLNWTTGGAVNGATVSANVYYRQP